jgi:NAD(P)H-hydrate repair Nnr-like enzyme with NAD(P)H-hydrate dehydratase domain
MTDTFWHKQSAKEPLYKDLLWSRPENKRQAGKLLIIGGNKFVFAAVGSAYAAAQSCGAGSIRVLLPDALTKTVGRFLPEAEFAPSTPSGSFGRASLASMLDLAEWADGVLLAGDFGRNSETAIVLDRFLNEYKGQVTLQHDALDYFWTADSPVFARPKTTIITNLGKLQKFAKNNRPETPVLHSMSVKSLVELLHDWTTETEVSVLTKQADYFVAAVSGLASTTPSTSELAWQTELGARAAVWQLQQPSKPFAAITTAVYDYVS